MSKPKPNNQLRSGLVTVLIIVAIGAAIIAVQLISSAAPAPTPTGQRMTLDPQIITNLTQMPDALPLSGEAAAEFENLKTLVEACPDYIPARLSQMQQHIQWLLNPAAIPPDIIIALGSDPPTRLIYGMASYTAIQWQTGVQSPDSCLLPIGRILNDMLSAVGEARFPVFDEAP